MLRNRGHLSLFQAEVATGFDALDGGSTVQAKIAIFHVMNLLCHFRNKEREDTLTKSQFHSISNVLKSV